MKTYDELKSLIEQRGVHVVFGAPGEGWAIEQNADELAQFLVVCQEHGVQSVLEIGTGYRAGLARFLHDDMGWHVTSVDIHDYGHQFGGIQFITQLWRGTEYPVFDQQFDLVMIDADHSYEAVKDDHFYYGKYAAKIIAFHDITGLRDCEGVRDYWNDIAHFNASINDTPEDELRAGYHEIIAPSDQRGGIGYIVLSELKTEPTPETEGHTWKGLDGEIKEGYVDSTPAKPAPSKKTPTKKSAARKTAAKK